MIVNYEPNVLSIIKEKLGIYPFLSQRDLNGKDLPIVKRARKLRSFSDSMHKFSGYANNSFNILNEFPKPIPKLVKDYWSNHADDIRQYRNLVILIK